MHYAGTLNDAWRFNSTSRGWTFMAGSTTVNAIGKYGVKGIPSGGIIPPRHGPVSWIDPSNEDIIIFGGSGATSPITGKSIGKSLKKLQLWAGF